MHVRHCSNFFPQEIMTMNSHVARHHFILFYCNCEIGQQARARCPFQVPWQALGNDNEKHCCLSLF